jgi:hypothetical protein
MLAAPPVQVEPLPANRIALRAALCAVLGALGACVVALPLVVMSGDAEAGWLMFDAAASGLTMAPFFAVAVELVRRLPARARLAALIATGALSPLLVYSGIVYLYLVGMGAGPQDAWRGLIDWLGMVVTSYLAVSVRTTVAVLIPFSLLGAAHAGGVPGALGRTIVLPARVALGVVTGAVAGAIVWVTHGPTGSERTLFAGWILVPPALEVTLALALRVEARLLTWWTTRREAA